MGGVWADDEYETQAGQNSCSGDIQSRSSLRARSLSIPLVRLKLRLPCEGTFYPGYTTSSLAYDGAYEPFSASEETFCFTQISIARSIERTTDSSPLTRRTSTLFYLNTPPIRCMTYLCEGRKSAAPHLSRALHFGPIHHFTKDLKIFRATSASLSLSFSLSLSPPNTRPTDPAFILQKDLEKPSEGKTQKHVSSRYLRAFRIPLIPRSDILRLLQRNMTASSTDVGNKMPHQLRCKLLRI